MAMEVAVKIGRRLSCFYPEISLGHGFSTEIVPDGAWEYSRMYLLTLTESTCLSVELQSVEAIL